MLEGSVGAEAASCVGIESDTISCNRKAGLDILVDIFKGDDVRDCETGLVLVYAFSYVFLYVLRTVGDEGAAAVSRRKPV